MQLFKMGFGVELGIGLNCFISFWKTVIKLHTIPGNSFTA
jgi:hypothetical protein